MRTDEFDYELPPELIAQTPTERGESRLLVLHRESGRIEHRSFRDLPEYLNSGDVLVLNDTRVTARRLRALRPSGAGAEVLLLCPTGELSWEALVKPARPFHIGDAVVLLGPGGCQATAEVNGITAEGGRVLQLRSRAERDALQQWGEAPLPPYIHTPLAPDQEGRYQTVYAQHDGSAAAPTAGLHFTPDMLDRLGAMGVETARATLHVGVGTFRPVRTELVHEHEMHAETAALDAEAAARINGAAGRVVAVGTTSVRTLESAAKSLTESGPPDRVAPFLGETKLFITPGYTFRAVDALITNFHLPRSTLLMLVCAFAGVEPTRRAYRAAIDARYRFFSFGDAMLII